MISANWRVARVRGFRHGAIQDEVNRVVPEGMQLTGFSRASPKSKLERGGVVFDADSRILQACLLAVQGVATMMSPVQGVCGVVKQEVG